MALRLMPIIFMGLMHFALTGCVGPSSPFGALELGSGDGLVMKKLNYIDDSEKKMNYQPRRQILHEPRNLKVVIRDDELPDQSEDVDIRAEYNGRDVTHAFRKYLRVSEMDDDEVLLAYENLKLSPAKNHDIQFYFSYNGGKKYIRSQFLPPKCSMYEKHEVVQTDPFVPKTEYLDSINRVAKNYAVNPALLAALIAQESGFDSQAKSRKNALGLTQITGLGADEIEKIKPEWRASRNSSTGTDWRKTPQLSIEGGAVYLKYLADYWADSNSKEVLMKSTKQKDDTAVLLASYNSGAARVKKNMNDFGQQWFNAGNLKEAFKYVNNISSYCYHFAGEPE